ncbi:hypothetical protein GCM10027093_09440 [Paraburkholderia jirisanensis]
MTNDNKWLEQLMQQLDESVMTIDQYHANYLTGYITEALIFRPVIYCGIDYVATKKKIPYTPQADDYDPPVTRLLQVLNDLGFTLQVVPKD